MATEVVMPQMGESIAEGTITKWLVKPGDSVVRDQPLFEISTDKVDAEIPSPADGVLIEVRYDEGATVAVDEVVAMIGEAGSAPTPQPSAETAVATATTPRASEPASAASSSAPAAPSSETSEEDQVRRFSSPVVRKIAEEEKVDIAQVEGTGVSGRVTKKDILAHLEERQSQPAAPTPVAAPVGSSQPAPPTAPATAPTSSGRPAGDFWVPAYTASEEVVIEPMTKIRQITAAHMTYSKATSAHVTTVYHFDLTRLHQTRERAKRKFGEINGTKLTYMPFVFRAVCEALKANPQVNASIDGTNIVYKKNINLGMAVAMDRGLIVPVIHKADQLSLIGLARTANDLADRARNKRLLPAETQQGTFTITNPGVFGSLFGTPVINQPQVAILGLGTIEKRPVVVTDALGADAIAIRVMSYFALTYDHRLIDGGDAEKFMNHIKNTLENDTWQELSPYL